MICVSRWSSSEFNGCTKRESKATRNSIPRRNQLVIRGVLLMSFLFYSFVFVLTSCFLRGPDLSNWNTDPNRAGYFSGTCVVCVREVGGSKFWPSCLITFQGSIFVQAATFFSHFPVIISFNLEVTLYVQDDYNWCERLHKFIGKNRSHHL